MRDPITKPFLNALKDVLGELPRLATGYRVTYGPTGYATVILADADGALVTCTVAQRVAPAGDGVQVTIDEVRNGRTRTAPVVADAPSPPVGKGQEAPRAQQKQTAPEAAPVARAVPYRDRPHRFDATDRSGIAYTRDTPGYGGSFAGMSVYGGYYSPAAHRAILQRLADADPDGYVRLYVDGVCTFDSRDRGDPPKPHSRKKAAKAAAPEATAVGNLTAPEPEAPADPPHADAAPDAGLCGTCGWGAEEPRGVAVQVRVKRSDWLKHRSGLPDVQGLSLHRQWGAIGDDRVSLLHPEEFEQVQEYCEAHGIELRIDPPPAGVDQYVSAPPAAPAIEAPAPHAPRNPMLRLAETPTTPETPPAEETDDYTSASDLLASSERLVRTLAAGPALIDVMALADDLEGAEPAKKGRAKKGAKLFRDQSHEFDKPWAHPNTPHLVIRVNGTTHTTLRPKGFDDSAWRAFCRGYLAEAQGYEVARLYSNRGKCIWDSRDGGEP